MVLTLGVLAIAYCTAVCLLQLGVESLFLGEKTVCYEPLGCFSSGPPFKSPERLISVVPSSPDHIRTKFILYTLNNNKIGQELDARNVSAVRSSWTHFKNRPTKIVSHGFLDDINIFPWIGEIKDELLINGDYNVILVDWHHGNGFPYTQATANTRVVGAQIALLVKQLTSDFKIAPGDFHIIGHSLGSHIAGYAGERVVGLGRITGLDPAGPDFAGTDEMVRLDPTDALLVDTIHTDGEKLSHLGFGLKQPDGHMDFYPNLGHDQPGCKKEVLNLLKVLYKDGIADAVACNHMRSVELFKESINSKCQFKSVPCANQDDFKKNKCHSCANNTCASMGFNADKNKPPGGAHVKYYTTTAKESPFCQYHIDVEIKLAKPDKAQKERGTFEIRVTGENGTTKWIKLDSEPHYYQPGKTYEHFTGSSRNIGKVLSVEYKWNHHSSVSDPFSWNPFNMRNPKIFLSEIDVLNEESGENVKMCRTADYVVENNHLYSISKPCQ